MPGRIRRSWMPSKKLPQTLETIAKSLPSGTPMRVLFQDEGRFGRISDARSCWAPLPLRPSVRSQLVREYIYAYVAVCPADGQMSSMILPWVDARLMSIFLAQTAAQFSDEYCVMFLDGAGWHKAHEFTVPANMRLLPLPPYSPELNPAERVWSTFAKMIFAIKSSTLWTRSWIQSRQACAIGMKRRKNSTP